MQPRRDLWPRLETVFQVTNRGCSSFCAGEDAERREKEKNEELDEDLDVLLKATWDEVVECKDGVDDVDAVEGDTFWRRDMLGRRRSERGTGASI